MPPLPIEHYHVGIICALDSEMAAVQAMLDEEHEPITKKSARDHNAYSVGRIHNHNVVVACLPAGVDGLAAAATVAKDMLRTFTQLRFGLLVGIGGGIPNLECGVDIRLGDVVVSQPTGSTSGVVQYDKGKSKAGGDWEHKGTLNMPPVVLLAALQKLRARHLMVNSLMPRYLTDMLQRYPKMISTGYAFPGADNDVLYPAVYDHVDSKATCTACEEGQQVIRPTRPTTNPEIYYGVIASGNQVIKNATVRDYLRQQCDALCVEMEAAGLMNEFPCLVIRGVCDYADSHKNDGWHRYAAATAASYAKELLLYVSAEQTSEEKPIQQIPDPKTHELLDRSVQLQERAFKQHHRQAEQLSVRYETEQERHCHQALKTSTYEEYKDNNPNRVPETCLWVVDHPQFQAWQQSRQNDLLWISADPGCGKSVLSKFLVDDHLADVDRVTVCYFFFKDKEQQDHLTTALCALLHQLFSRQPHLIRHALPAWEKNKEHIQSEVNELWRILLAAASDAAGGSVVCVLDALDECRDEDRRRLISKLSEFHQRSSPALSGTLLKFLVLSRPYDSVQRWFNETASSLPQIRLRGEEENDLIHEEINLVIDQQIDNLATEFSLSKDHQGRLRQSLRQMQHRTYLWLYLAMQDIRTTYENSPDPEDELINTLPTSVENAYETYIGKNYPTAKVPGSNGFAYYCWCTTPIDYKRDGSGVECG